MNSSLNLLKFLIGCLATWRLAALLISDYGPFDVFEKLRKRLGVYFQDEYGRPNSLLGKLFSCMWCMSIWSGTLATLICMSPLWWLMVPFAFSAVAIVIENITD
jgi:hypothetical protein